MNKQDKVVFAARVAHEANRAYCIMLGDLSQKPWDEAPDWQKESAIKGVEGVIAGNTPAQSHASWMQHKQDNGWIWGPVKDEQVKTHPCMVPYEQLPADQKLKDALYVGVVRTLLAILNG